MYVNVKVKSEVNVKVNSDVNVNMKVNVKGKNGRNEEENVKAEDKMKEERRKYKI